MKKDDIIGRSLLLLISGFLSVLLFLNTECKSMRHLYDNRVNFFQKNDEYQSNTLGRNLLPGTGAYILWFRFEGYTRSKAANEIRSFIESAAGYEGFLKLLISGDHAAEVCRTLEENGWAPVLREEYSERQRPSVLLIDGSGRVIGTWLLDSEQPYRNLMHLDTILRMAGTGKEL